jgi:hypothetical protein
MKALRDCQNCSADDDVAVCPHEPVDPFGSPCSPARTRRPPLPGCRAPDAGDGSYVEGAPVPPLGAGRSIGTPAGTPSTCFTQVEIDCGVGSNSGASSSGAHQIDHLSLVTPADNRFGNGAERYKDNWGLLKV